MAMDVSMSPDFAAVEAEALEWIIRVRRPEFAEWDELTDRLGADPRLADGFQRLALLDDEIATAFADEAAWRSEG